MYKLLTISIFSSVMFGACYAQSDANLILQNVSIVDVSGNRIIPAQSIVISDGIIESIRNERVASASEGTRVIDGSSLYVAPGLADMHVHAGEADLGLFLANGVTTILEMNGSPEKLAIRDRVRSGELVGPRIYMTSPLLAGTPQNFAYELVEDNEAAYSLVKESKDLGYDFIKVYDGLSEQAYRTIVSAADEFSIPLVGHIPDSMELQNIIDDQFSSIEHVEQLARATVGHNFDEAQIPEIVAVVAKGNTAITPTLAAMEILNARRSAWFDELFERDEMRFTPPEVRDWWQSMRSPEQLRSGLVNTPPGGTGDAIQFYRSLAQQLEQSGILLLSGTDTPNPLLVPGFSLHHELAALTRAGLSNSSVLSMATKNPAIYLHAEGSFGDIEVEMEADLLLLRGNPLIELSALQEIEGIFTQGRWFDSETLASFVE